jgi:hypothetical protein
VLLVEQDVSQALRVASHLQCLLEGHTTLEGRPSDVTPEQVEAAYFGLGTPTGPGSSVSGPGGAVSPSPGGDGGAGSPQGGSGGMGPPRSGGVWGGRPPEEIPSRGGLRGIVPPEEGGSLWPGSTTSSRES